ncbi:MAG: nucleotide exchange factor GrpE, partial [Deltaproteobacteria bacterium]
MSYRRHPLAPGVVDVATARRAVAEVAQERDALARQLERAQGVIASLQRQLAARNDENAQLTRTVQLLRTQLAEQRAASADTRSAGPSADSRFTRLQQELAALRKQVAALQDEVAAARQERDEAIAERDRVQAALDAARAECDALRQASPDGDRVQRLAADLANLRRHQAETIERGIRERTDRLLLELLSVRDSVQRALSWLPEGATAWQDGLNAVRARIDGVLASEGVQAIGAPGERFDPNLHEA